MDQKDADALKKSIYEYAGLASEENFTLHAEEGVHMNSSAATARAVSDPTKPCGYFQKAEVTKTVTRKDKNGWDLATPITEFKPTGKSIDVNNVEYLRLIKAFFRGSVTAKPSTKSTDLAEMSGRIPDGFTGYTNAIGTANYSAVANMRAIIRKGSNWKLVTIYPVA